MARRPRILFRGAMYHAMSRGNRKAIVFIDQRDRHRFLRIVQDSLERYAAVCYGYCLMGNHYHLVLGTPGGNVSAVMRHINGLYTQYANWRYQWTGHVFEGRFTATVIDDNTYLLNALRYLARNPIEAGLVAEAADWEWSSYRAAMGRCVNPPFLSTDWMGSLFPAETLEESRAQFAKFVSEASTDDEGIWEPVKGTPRLKREVRSVVGASQYRFSVPRSYRELGQPPLRELFDGVRKDERRIVILRAHVVHGYRMAEIARYLDLHPTTISRIVNRSGSYGTTE